MTWLVFREAVEVSAGQLDAMRALKLGEEECGDCIVNNYRPPCSLGNRQIWVKTV